MEEKKTQKTGRRVRLNGKPVTLAEEVAKAEQAKPPKQQPQQSSTNWDSPKLRREKMRPSYITSEDVYDVYNDGSNYYDWN